ncbi:hypothetical protein A2V68_00770 [candidate division Kazan bacterium RBG_13_50_9]|uniref:Uncharacterized protein n=1 Tax=candidate division Kazan bacterium RBG_13_50_9 TaxID=1798535 RepID=A0A1F4NTS4_UNCK3|nr:MAG: hypothetical protein A2V68_00770 [candidate division Kazan bacterium RBG_13_50_9]
MADEPQQWEFGSPFDEEGGAYGGSEAERRKKEEEKKKSPAEQAKEKAEQIKKAQKRLKQLKEAPKKVREAARRANKEAAKQVQEIPKRAREAAQVAKEGARAAGQAGRVAAQAAARSARIASQVAIRAAQVAAKVAIETAKVAAKVAAQLAKFLANPYVLAAVILIIILIFIINIFLSAINGVSSLAGGSIFVPANYNNPLHRQIVSNLEERMQGCDPRLVVYEGGVEDLKWQYNSEAQRYSHQLDIRVLATLDYLTDDKRGHRIRIDLLKTGAPTLLRESFVRKLTDPTDIEGQEQETKETLSAFNTGQAIAIAEIDRSSVLPPTDMACGIPVPPPIQVNWQETVMERAVRPLWEELAFDVGFLDKNTPIYKGVIERGDREAILRVAKAYLASLEAESYDLYKETFRKIPRVYALIKRAMGIVGSGEAFDPRTSMYLSQATGSFNLLNDAVKGMGEGASEEAIANAITSIGELADRIREGAGWVYKATQVANMVNWDAPRKDGNTKWQKAYEARVKIRQVVKELLEMPREMAISSQGLASGFDKSLVVKQIITFSPEDDLDNGRAKEDVFPWGIIGVDIGGVEIALKGEEVGDGKVDYADDHFSHAPIDNGVFSKNGTNYVYAILDPDDPWWKKAGSFMFRFLNPVGQTISQIDKMHDLMVGGCIANSNETCKKVSYKDFLHVAF